MRKPIDKRFWEYYNYTHNLNITKTTTVTKTVGMICNTENCRVMLTSWCETIR